MTNLSLLQSEICSILVLIASHARRDANRVADHLANEGVNLIMGYLDRALETSPSDILIVDCHTLAQGDLVSLDGT